MEVVVIINILHVNGLIVTITDPLILISPEINLANHGASGGECVNMVFIRRKFQL